MKKLTAFCLLCIAAAYGEFEALSQQLRPESSRQESRSQEKPISQWVTQLKDKDAKARAAAANALAEIGPKAKAAFPDLKLAFKERSWEVWYTFLQRSSAPVTTFDKVSSVIGGTEKLTPAEEIENLKTQVASLERQLRNLQQQLFEDDCLKAIAIAMFKVDQGATEAFFGIQPASQTTFSTVGSPAAPMNDDKTKAK